MAYFLKAVCLLLYTLNTDFVRTGRAAEQYTILDINPLLQYQDYAIQVLSQLDMSETWHQELLSWWQNVYFNLPKQSSFRQEVIMPILSKIGVFNDNQVLRRIVGQAVTTAPIHEAVTAGKIVLCALSSRDLDDSSVNILGSTLINLLHRSFARQQHLTLTERRKVFVAVDELQNFSGSMFDKLLSEDAKFGCAMLLSTQNLKRLNQIKDGLLDIVFSNCDNLCAFNVSASDAEVLEEEFQQKITQKHIISQPRLHCYARLAIAGFPLQFASVQVARPASWNKDTFHKKRIREIRNLSRRRFLPAALVDKAHAEHLSQFLDVRDFAERIQQDARAWQATQQKQAKADELLNHVKAQRKSPSPSQTAFRSDQEGVPKEKEPHPPKDAQKPDTSASSSKAGTPPPQGLRTTPGSFTTAPSTDQASIGIDQPGSEETTGVSDSSPATSGRRNHSRSARNHGSRRMARLETMGTPADGSPAPAIQVDTTNMQVEEDAEKPRPRSSLSYRGKSSFEGREREYRERG